MVPVMVLCCIIPEEWDPPIMPLLVEWPIPEPISLLCSIWGTAAVDTVKKNAAKTPKIKVFILLLLVLIE